MKKIRLFLVATMSAGLILVGAPPAGASCAGEPVDPCVVVCSVGQGNKYTRDLFAFCNVW